jgi:hypothetical protein
MGLAFIYSIIMHIMLVISVLSTLKKVSVYYLLLLVLNWHMLIMVVTSVLSAVKKSEYLSVLNSTYQRKKKATFSFIWKNPPRLVARDVMHMFGVLQTMFCLQYRCFT